MAAAGAAAHDGQSTELRRSRSVDGHAGRSSTSPSRRWWRHGGGGGSSRCLSPMCIDRPRLVDLCTASPLATPNEPKAGGDERSTRAYARCCDHVKHHVNVDVGKLFGALDQRLHLLHVPAIGEHRLLHDLLHSLLASDAHSRSRGSEEKLVVACTRSI